jgi:flagellar basal body-associated protein FliL
MEWIALVAWILTAVGGFVLLSIWVARGGMQQAREAGSRIRPPLILSHFALAAIGLVLWIIYVATDSDALAWVAFVLLLVVAALGFTMFGIWWQRRQQRGVAEGADAATPAEQQFPVAIVAGHGVLAATTLVLVFLATIGVGS